MKKQLYTHIKIFARLLFITSFALSANQTNAQDIGADDIAIDQPEINGEATDDTTLSYDYRYQREYRHYIEIYTSLGHASYVNPHLWNNNDYYALGIRFITEDAEDDSTTREDYTEVEYGETLSKNSPIDGLTRQSVALKFGFGWIFNKKPAATSSFAEFGLGFIAASHFVQGEAAWKSPASEEVYYHQVAYESAFGLSTNPGIYFHAGYGIKIKNRHRLSFYITPVIEGTISVRGITYNDKNNMQSESYYYGAIPKQILYGMAGVRYSYIFQSSWEKVSSDLRRTKIPPPQ